MGLPETKINLLELVKSDSKIVGAPPTPNSAKNIVFSLMEITSLFHCD